MRRFETGSLVAAIGAALLLVSLFLSWFSPGLTAWDVFEVWDLVLAGLALAVLAVAAAELGWWRGPVPGVELVVLGAAALVIVVAALLNHPPAAAGRDTENGVWLGLVGAVLILGGGLIGRVGVSLSLSVDPKAERPRRPPPAPARAPGPSASASKADPPAAGSAPSPAPSPRATASRGRFPRRRPESTPEEETGTTRRLPRDTDLGPPPKR